MNHFQIQTVPRKVSKLSFIPVGIGWHGKWHDRRVPVGLRGDCSHLLLDKYSTLALKQAKTEMVADF